MGGGIAFIFARTDTRMFFDYVWNQASAVLFLKGRVKFLRADLTEAEAANAPSVLVAYGEDNVLALQNAKLNGKFLRLR